MALVALWVRGLSQEREGAGSGRCRAALLSPCWASLTASPTRHEFNLSHPYTAIVNLDFLDSRTCAPSGLQLMVSPRAWGCQNPVPSQSPCPMRAVVRAVPTGAWWTLRLCAALVVEVGTAGERPSHPGPVVYLQPGTGSPEEGSTQDSGGGACPGTGAACLSPVGCQ